MVPPLEKLLASKLSLNDETKEKNAFKIHSSNSDVADIKQKGSKVKLSFKYLKDVWLHKKQTQSAVSTECPSITTNQPSVETIKERVNQFSDTDGVPNPQSTEDNITEGKVLRIENIKLQHSKGNNQHSLIVNKNDELQKVLDKMEKKNSELLQKNLELTERNAKLVIVVEELENNQEALLNEFPKEKAFEEQLKAKQEEVTQLREEIEKSDETISNLKQEVFDLIHSIHSKDDGNIILSLKKEISKREHMIKESVEAGDILLEEMDNCRKLLKDIGKEIRINWARLKTRRHTFVDLFHISRGCISELSRQVVFIHNETDSIVQKMREDYLKLQKDLSKEKDQKHMLKEKLDFEIKHSKIMSEENLELKGRIKKLEDQIQHLDEYSQETKNNYESQVKKLSKEYSEKLAVTFEKQECLQNHMTQSMTEKAHMFDELKLIQKENNSLSSSNKIHEIQIHNLKHDLETLHESCKTIKNKLQQENDENLMLKNKLDSAVLKIEQLEKTCKEHEYALADGEMWCISMHHQDQAIVQELELCLMEKEDLINTLRTQGECGKADIEKLQSEVNLRKSKMDELKLVLADFEKKREQVVKDQKEFYTKIRELNKTASLRERVCENLIKENEKKSNIIESLEEKLNTAENTIVEIKEQAQKEIEELQSELKGAVERLQEYQKHIELMDRDLERQLFVMQKTLADEKLQKMAALEKLQTCQNGIEEMKKDTEQICEHLQQCEEQKNELEKIADKYHKEKIVFERTEVQVQELSHRLMSAEVREQDARIELEAKESSLAQCLKKISALQNKLQESQKCITESKNMTQQSKLDLSLLQEKERMFNFEKQQLESKLNEITRDRNFLQKDHEELCNKLISSVKMLMEAKLSHQKIETHVHNLEGAIAHLQEEKKHLEDGLESLKETVNKAHHTIKILEDEKYKLSKEIAQYLTNPKYQNGLKHQYEDCIKRLNKQLLDAKDEYRKMCHQHTQQFLHLQADKQRLEEFVENMNEEQNNKIA